MALESPYTAAKFNAIPEIMESTNRFKDGDVSSSAFQQIGQAFLKHQVHHNLGVALVHRHFKLAEHEMLVNIGNVAVPWDTKNLTNELVNPSSWRFSEDGVMPYEFTYGGLELPMDSRMREFLSNYRSVLEKNNLTNVFGLCTLGGVHVESGPPTMEFTSGRANITLPFDLNSDEGGSVEASWQIEQGDDLGMVVFGQCKNRCRTGPNTGHREHHKHTKC